LGRVIVAVVADAAVGVNFEYVLALRRHRVPSWRAGREFLRSQVSGWPIMMSSVWTAVLLAAHKVCLMRPFAQGGSYDPWSRWLIPEWLPLLPL
jgi:hypothetical protein